MLKKVKYLIPAYDVDMGGMTIKQALPTHHVSQVDPFLLLHHGKFNFKDTSPALHQGIGPHPHKGFSPVSFIIEGEVHHRDSWGNSQIAKKGEVQWMHAGAGIIHSERPSQKLTENNGRQEVIQLWINSPAQNKKQAPHYQYLPESDITVFSSEDQLANNKLIAGNYKHLRGKIKSESDLLIIWSEAKKGASQSIAIPKGFNSMLYLIKGELRIGGYGKIEKESLLVFDFAEGDVECSSNTDSQYVMFCGKPIDEKMVHHGPFVMNTTTEIMEAMRDYQMGKMGVLIES